ncbi:DUF3021 domain-containing protein [Peribacillus muralis]|uniref:DUF3021 domain-containing protein n=1 Tax=Peribacillus muralis TaxID=264697 RepID=UPI001F4DAF6F|nr:DUF3021 domain-containing protein [Peribacillus muralis]MCK1993260.1 DUF3021 domain-containing protein [Peribacillus muralis]MCK2013814.1 DUF3021 domain-containing protein [Peribacillus muralis]
MKTLLFRSFVGICFGALVMVLTCFGVIGFGEITALDSEMFVKNAIGCLLCGWFFSTATILFEIEKWSLLFQTTMHFLTVSILYFLLSFFVGWISFSMKGLVIGILIFIPFYVTIWTIFYLYFRFQMKILNDGLDKRRN